MKRFLSMIMVFVIIATMIPAVAVSAEEYTEGYYTYEVVDGEATITGFDDSYEGELVIPDTLGGCHVVGIGEWAFEDCTGLTSITIPDSVTSIGEYAFSSCTGLTSITISDSVTSIGGGAFCSCTGLTEIKVADGNTSYKDIEGVLFTADGTSLIQYPLGNSRTEYVIPDSVTSIGDGAFYECTGLTSITIPDSVTSIGDDAFRSCAGLTSIIIPDSVTNIGDRAFYGCTGLTSITIPDSVTSIGRYAFYWCYSLTSITIPDSVTTIGDRAFYNCTGLTDVYYGGSESEWNSISIGYYNDYLTNATIHFNWEGDAEPDINYGDSNGDGDVNLSDVTLLLRYMLGWNVDADVSAADVNGDGNITLRDATLLLQFIAGWDVVLGPQA